MDNPKNKRTDSLCPSPDQLLLSAVEENAIFTIKRLVRENSDLLTKIYDFPHYKPILYVAISSLADKVLEETVQTLIDLGADLFYHSSEDYDQEAIHFAVVGQNPSILRTVIKNIRLKNKDKVNAVTTYGGTALNLLISEGNVESPSFEKCLKVLLDCGIDVNIADSKNETAIVVAAKKQNRLAVKLLLDSGKFVDIDNYKYKQERTKTEKTARKLIEENDLYDDPLPEYLMNNNTSNRPDKLFSYLKDLNQDAFVASKIVDVDEAIPEGTLLQIACDRNLDRAVLHLLEHKADVMKVTTKQEKTPIEIAGENGFWKIFEYLLPSYEIIPDGLLALLLRNSINDISNDRNHRKCLKVLIESDKNIPVNTFLSGNSALHYASKYTNSTTVLNLLRRGASLANKNSYNLLPIEDIPPKTLERHFDSCITMTHIPAYDKQSTIVTFDYKTLMPTTIGRQNKVVDIESKLIIDDLNFTRETDVLMELAKVRELRHLLKHPLITSLLYLKWQKIERFFLINLFFYCLFVLSLFLYIFVPKNDSNAFINFLSVSGLVLTYVILSLREFSQILISPKSYFISFENWLELCLIFITGYIIFEPDKDHNLFKQFSAAAILLSALEMMLLIGQHPKLSTHIVIFRTVSSNFFRFLLWYAILILAFVFSFYKLFNKTQESHGSNSTIEDNGDKDFFTEPDLTFIKIIVMLTGEFDASSLDFDTVSNKLLFLVFVFLIPIILFNLLNGLAVSDTQMIKNDAEVIGYIERIHHIVYFENMMLGNAVPTTMVCLLGKCSCCCDFGNFKQYTAQRWLAQKICLFPHTYDNYKMEMFLYHKGKVKRNVEGRCKRLKEIYVDKKTVKRVKQMLNERNDEANNVGDEIMSREQIKILQDTINKLVVNGCLQCKARCFGDISLSN